MHIVGEHCIPLALTVYWVHYRLQYVRLFSVSRQAHLQRRQCVIAAESLFSFTRQLYRRFEYPIGAGARFFSSRW